MSKFRSTFVITAGALLWFALSTNQSADAQVTVQFGTPGYHVSQHVYWSNSFTSPRYSYQPNYGYFQPYSPYQIRERLPELSPELHQSGGLWPPIP